MPVIKNERYLSFNKTGTIEIITTEQFSRLLNQIDYERNKEKTKQARALAILLFYSGLRPCELSKVVPADMVLTKKNLKLKFCANKRGRFSTIWLPMNDHIKELWDYSCRGLPHYPVFFHFSKRSPNKVKYIVKKTGLPVTKIYSRFSYNINYLFKRFFGFPPYFLRHNAFSALADLGATDRQLMQAKGAANFQSIAPYIHLSEEQGLKIAKLQKKR